MQNKKVDRARQFMPFDGLKGYREMIKAKEHVIVDKKQLSEDSLELLQYKMEQIKLGDMVTIIYYLKDEYVKIEGIVSKINLDERYIQIVKTKIPLDDIYEIIL